MTEIELKIRADQGDEKAMLELAEKYYFDDFGENRGSEAVALYQQLANEFLNPKAISRLGDCYYDGFGIEKNREMAVKLWQKSAELGFADAQYEWGKYLKEQGDSAHVDWFTKAAIQGNGNAAQALAEYCYHGIDGMKQDKEKALYWAEKGAKAGNQRCYQYAEEITSELYPQDIATRMFALANEAADNSWYAQVSLALMYTNGLGTNKDPEKALSLIDEACEAGWSDALSVRAQWYVTGKNGSEINAEKAITLWKTAAEKGNINSMRFLGIWYVKDAGNDFRQGFEWLKKAIDAGDEHAENIMATACKKHIIQNDVLNYLSNHEKSISIDREVYDCIRFLAEKGNVDARITLVHATNVGLYTDQVTYKQSMDWLRESADGGSVLAQSQFGSQLIHGGLFGGNKEAEKYLQMAAQNGDIGSKSILGRLVVSGDNELELNDDIAMQYLQEAANAGDEDAPYYLALCYLNGNHIEKDVNTGIKYLEDSAEKGNEDAQILLGTMYVTGENISPDRARAINLLKRAADSDNRKAQRILVHVLLKDRGVDIQDLKLAEELCADLETHTLDPQEQIELGKCYKRIAIGYIDKTDTSKCATSIDYLNKAIQRLEKALSLGLDKDEETLDFYESVQKLKKGYQEASQASTASDVSNAPAKKSGGCYVATAVYGSYDCPEVWTLRRFRDYQLANTWYGRLFIRIYYTISPTLVRWFGKAEWFHRLCRKPLDKMVAHLHCKGFEDTPYND